jgi:hypothetical protein
MSDMKLIDRQIRVTEWIKQCLGTSTFGKILRVMSYVLEFGVCSSFKVPPYSQFVFDKVKTDIVNNSETFIITTIEI